LWLLKNEKSNISSNEEKAFKIIAKSLLTDLELNQLIKDEILLEINNE